MSEMRQQCTLELSDGTRMMGELIGAPLVVSGELVFTTGMVGYSEALTDPSYFGQILIFSYPLIGNYGIPPLPKELANPIPAGFESPRVNAAAVVVTVDSEEAFHWNSFQSLDKWLENQGVPGITGIDTRHLVHLVRNTPKLKGRLRPHTPTGQRSLGQHTDFDHGSEFFDPSAQPILRSVVGEQPVTIGEGKIKIGLIDCGVKWNIIRQLLSNDCQVEIIPWHHNFSEISCDGWLISNGPGDPKQTEDLISRVQPLLEQDRPMLGICLGHQILSLAAGFKTKRMAYGHRSHNQPVYLVGTRRGSITSQNHGYVVEDANIPKDWEVWFRNANDQSIEGIKHKQKPLASVQFHPEAAGGPRDTGWIIHDFITEVKRYAAY